MTARTECPSGSWPPPHAIGADLIWWRTSAGMRTTVTLFWSGYQAFGDPVHLDAFLFDPGGACLANWRMELVPHQPLFIDSGATGPWQAAEGIDGVVALYVCCEDAPSASALEAYNRLFPVLEWTQQDGRVAMLHSDQVIRRGTALRQDFTEIVIHETCEERNALVVLNGEQGQAADCFELNIRNSLGQVRSAAYATPMAPFTVHRIELAKLFPELQEFGAGEPLQVGGSFSSNGLFSRPYVETTGRRWGVYHAGNVYAWPTRPWFQHAFIGGEVNPMAVVHGGDLRTYVNILHSHGEMEEDVQVDASLFDTQGRCVAQRHHWRLARRHGLVRADVAELIADPSQPFEGHIALSFSPTEGGSVPWHLQALLEYRNGSGVARVMAWSDEWNSELRLAMRARSGRHATSTAFCRVRDGAGLTTRIAITNAGPQGYHANAQARIKLHGRDGPVAETTVTLGPHTTLMATTCELFPQAHVALGDGGLGLLMVESESDLASVAFCRHEATGAIAAEHFMPVCAEADGQQLLPAGA